MLGVIVQKCKLNLFFLLFTLKFCFHLKEIIKKLKKKLLWLSLNNIGFKKFICNCPTVSSAQF